MTEEKHPHYVLKAMKRLHDDHLLVRQCATTDEAIQKGDGHLYFTHPDGKTFPTTSACYAIKNGLVSPVGDSLFSDGDSQTYAAKAAWAVPE